jgi:molecular chaperone IbpA
MLLKEDVDMMTFDLSPLYRSTIGFDRFAELFDAATHADVGGFPPYNIEAQSENSYRITMAVAGFGESDLSIVQQDNELVVTGRAETDAGTREYLYRGIAGSTFERRFRLADHVKVTEASLDNGLLRIDLVRELPEALRPRKIEIVKSGLSKWLGRKSAA